MTTRLTKPPFEVDVRYEGDHVVVSVTGELDAYTVPWLRDRLLEQAAAGRHTLVVDLADMPFSDSSGIGTLVGALKRARANRGALCLLSPSDHFAKMLGMTGLTRVLPSFGLLQDALDYLDSARQH